VNEGNMSDKLGWMRQLPRADAASLQKEFEGKKEELADLDYSGILPILKALEDAGELDSTMIFFTSDNGYLRGEHRLHAKDHPYWESSMVPFLVKGPGVRRGARRNAFVNHTDLMPTTCEIAGISSASLDVDGRSMLPHLGAAAYSGWRKKMLVTGSDDVGPEMNPGGADYPGGRWGLLRENEKAFILHENGEKELYWMNEDPHQKRNGVEQAAPALIERMTNTTEAMKAAAGETRRKLEEA
jgi:N-acetylglucosamine-6-sulfatase